jgi:hypothetical protein
MQPLRKTPVLPPFEDVPACLQAHGEVAVVH